MADMLGCKLVGFYYCFGEDDAVLIIEGPDEVTVASAIIGAAAGHPRSVRTTPLQSNEQGMEAMRKSATAALRSPRQQALPRGGYPVNVMSTIWCCRHRVSLAGLPLLP